MLFVLLSCWSEEMKIINLIAAIAGGGGIIPFRNASCKQVYVCLGTTDLGSLFSEEQRSKGTTLYGNSPASKQL